jgi:hypothetical protein
MAESTFISTEAVNLIILSLFGAFLFVVGVLMLFANFLFLPFYSETPLGVLGILMIAVGALIISYVIYKLYGYYKQ